MSLFMCAGAVLQRRLQAICLNLLEQLGALCASQTRKDTILQGKRFVSVQLCTPGQQQQGCSSNQTRLMLTGQ